MTTLNIALSTTKHHEIRVCLTTWNISLAHFRQRLCWQGKITTGFVNISRQIGQISCFSRLSIVSRFLECDRSRDRLVTHIKRNAPKLYLFLFYRQQRPSSGNEMKLVNNAVSLLEEYVAQVLKLFLPLPRGHGARSVFSTHISVVTFAWPYMKSDCLRPDKVQRPSMSRNMYH